MKACIVSKHFYPFSGGLEARVFDFARWLSAKGDDVLIVTSSERGSSADELVEGVRVKRSSVLVDVSNALVAPGIFFDLMGGEYDFIDVNLPDPVDCAFAYAASVLRRKPLFVTYHADILRQGWVYLPFKLLYFPFERLVFKRAKMIFVTSKEYAVSSEELKGFMERIVVAPNFVDTKKYSTAVDGSRVRKELGLDGGKMVLFVGRLVEYKGVEYLLEAARSLPQHTFVIAGSGSLEESLRKKAQGLSNVVFAGKVPDDMLPSYYAACDVFVLPSVTRQEAFGIVLLEAMACGKPVVSTNFSGMPYVVGDGGLLVEPRDSKALAEAIQNVLGDDKLAKKLGGNGLKRVKELFDRVVVCARIRETYSSALKPV
ncbi:MAG: glycosyltransferase [Candidatus Altiarchaeota archaeon]